MVLEEELAKRYFLPQIRAVYDLKSHMGVMTWEVETDRGRRQFEVRGRDNVRHLPGSRLVLRDVDGNRYEISDYRALDAKSLDLLEQFVV